jgi:hypothetical protein
MYIWFPLPRSHFHLVCLSLKALMPTKCHRGIHDDAKAVKHSEYAREETMQDALLVRLHIQHDDVLLDRHSHWDLLALHPADAIDGPVAEHP